ncbi:MAG: cytochrome b/b6 domain-containing protein [Gammaproteobacteria bacterium]|nr:cytochrome b/b6 domain-containing protein [Gammaproteobacteria bacterium]
MPAVKRVMVWDVPTRVFHWSLLASFAAAWLTSTDNRFLYHHTFAGYTFTGLLIFRLLWGMVGSRYARFRTFAYDWPSVRSYLSGLLTGKAARYLGHNPVGGWVILLIIALGFLVSIAGILVLGGEEGHGPFAGYIPYDIGEYAKAVHEASAWTMLAIVGVHITGVVAESFLHRENLILAMLTGYKEGGGDNNPEVSGAGIIGVVLFSAMIAAGLLYFRGYLVDTADRPFVPFAGPKLPDNAVWRQECGECHLAFHPTLLPARSWQRLMDTQSDHFGDDLALDAQTAAEISSFLVSNAAESRLTKPARKILASTPADQTPLRITQTTYWKRKHSGVKQEYWTRKNVGSKVNCKACHLDAEAGTFEDSGMRLPGSDQLMNINLGEK